MKKLIRSILNKLPLAILLPLFKMVRAFNVSERTYRHLHFKGIFKVKLSKGRSFKLYHHGYQLENEIFWSGIDGKYEGTSLDLWLKLAENSNVIFDVGANTGVYAVSAKGMNNSAKVYAFEPLNRIFQKLEKNNTINKYDIECIEMALSSETGTAIISDDTTNHQYIASLEKDRLAQNENAEKITIQKIDFATFVEQKKITGVDLMKIDVEYHEFEVLKGMKQYIAEFKPDMLVEIVEADIASQIDELLKGLNYEYYNIDDDNGKIIKIDSVTRSNTYNILICKPETALKIGLAKML